MSVKFIREVDKLKSKIQEQCSIYRENYVEFFDLIEILRQQKKLNDETGKHCEQILSLMNNGEVRVIFCGQVKSGKTKCVMEFLSGAVELPSRDIPATKYFTKLFFSDDPVMYSESLVRGKTFYNFDGKFVGDEIIGDRINNTDEDLNFIFNIGIRDEFLKDCVMVIDSPGLNETKSLDEMFKINLKKLNPQVIIYVFNYGPGFVDSDCVYYTTVTSTLRKDLRQIFLFNKFDEAFRPTKKFHDPDGSDESDESESSDDEDEDKGDNFEELYQLEFDKHKKKLDSIDGALSCSCLIGYSGKYAGLHRCKKDEVLKPFRNKHLELLNRLKCDINSLDCEVLESILRYTKQFLFTEFQTIFQQISQSNNTSQHNLLSVSYRDKIINRFVSSHEKMLSINISQIEKIQFDGAIGQIVKNQERIQTTGSQTKFFNIINSLTKFFIDRYVNFFSNIILTKLEELCFDKINDDLRLNGLDKFFTHTFCSLSYEIDKMETIICGYFEKEEERVKAESIKLDQRGFQTSEATIFYIKNHYKFEKDLIWVHVVDFMATVIEKERQSLEKAIEEKKNEIITDLTLSKEQIKIKIKESIYVVRKFLLFNNNYVLEKSRNDCISEEKCQVYQKILNTELTNEKTFVRYENSLNIVFKKEHFNIDELSYTNCGFIKYFLRTQYNSNYTCKTIFYYKETEQSLYFITDVEDWKPLREFLDSEFSETDKLEVIKNLIQISIGFYKLSLPLDNFGPDMVFCKRTDGGIEIKIVETTQRSNEWKYTLKTGQVSDVILHKYPFTNVDLQPSMLYSLCWTILIIFHGSCDNRLPGKVTHSDFNREIEKIITNFSTHRIFNGCCEIIQMGLKEAIRFEEINDIVAILEKMIE